MNLSASSEVPERNRVELLIALAVFASACLYLWPLRDFLSFNADEGITLVYAQRILRGQVPYRDFFTFVTPGSPYLMALWFKLFGASLIVARSILLAYSGIFGAITYLLTRRNYDRTTALFTAAILILGCLPYRLLVNHNWDSTLSALLTIYCAQRLLETSIRFWWFSVSFAAALTFILEQSKGAGVLLGLALAAVVLSVSPKNRLQASVSKFCWAVAGFAIPMVILFAYFASQHAIGAMLEAWIWPVRHYSMVNRLTFGTVPISAHDLHDMFTRGPLFQRTLIAFFSAPMFLIPVFTLLILASTTYLVVLRYKTVPSTTFDTPVLGGCVFFGVFLSTLATCRADMHHLLYLTPLFMYLMPSVFDIKHKSVRFLYRTRPIIACLLLFSFTSFGLITVFRASAPSTQTETRRGKTRYGYPDEVIRYVQDNVTEGQHLYVHPYQPLYSFLTGTTNPTRFDFLQPGMATTDQYESAIHDLAADQTKVVLLDPNFAADKIPVFWPATPLKSIASDPVTDYILQHYRTCSFLNSNPPQVWSFYYMVRKGMDCPTSARKMTK